MPISRKKNPLSKNTIMKNVGRIDILKNIGMKTRKARGVYRNNRSWMLGSISRELSQKNLTYKNLYEQETEDIERTMSVLKKYY